MIKSLSPIFKILLALAVVALALSGITAPALAQGGQISGKVAVQGNAYPLPEGTLVKLFSLDLVSVRGTADPSLVDGSFSLGPLPSGMYVIKAVPPEASQYTHSLPRLVFITNGGVEVGTLVMGLPQVTGIVFEPGGVNPAPADVFVYAGNNLPIQHIPAPTGEFALGGLHPGSYWLQAFPSGDSPLWKSNRVALNITNTEAVQTVNLTLRLAQLWGYTQDERGAPLPNVKVHALRSGASFWGLGMGESDLSNTNGYWAIGGLSAGEYVLTAHIGIPQADLLPPQPITVTLPGATNPYTMTFTTPNKLVTGLVQTNGGMPVQQAQVIARRVNQAGHADTLTGADGTYQLHLGPGLWAMTVRPVTETVPGGWTYPQAPQLVRFDYKNQEETRQVDFTVLLADATVHGVIALPEGGTPTFTVTVGLHSSEGQGALVRMNPLNGSFSAQVPGGGYKVVVLPANRDYVGPVLEPVQVPAGGELDLGTLTLVACDATIQGMLTVNGGGSAAGVPVTAWREGFPGTLHTLSGPDGNYTLKVSAGEWQVRPAPTPQQAYLFVGLPQTVSVVAGGSASGVNFTLVAAGGVIHGALVDESGAPLNNLEGWASAQNTVIAASRGGAPIQNGEFTIYVPAGTYWVRAYLPPGSEYTASAERDVTVTDGAITEVTLTLERKSASISGALWDARNSDLISGVHGAVSAWQGANWVSAPINADNGAYRLDVAVGIWRVDYRIDPQSNYVRLAGGREVAVTANQNVILPLPVAEKDAHLGGRVLQPDGNPLAGALVVVEGVGGVIDGVRLHTRSAADGSFEFALPYGRYRLGAAGGDPAWVNPAEKLVEVAPGASSDGHILQFQQANATLSGTLTVSGTVNGGQALVFAWSDNGGFARGHFSLVAADGKASGVYSLDVISGTLWHVVAFFESGNQFWSSKADVNVDGPAATLDIILDGPFVKPAPLVVTFDASQPQQIDLPDGASIYIPGGALPVEGLVTLRIIPLAGLPHQRHAQVLRYGYAFLASDSSGQPIEAYFNQEVSLTFRYRDQDLGRLLESRLKPAYYSTTDQRWIFPESFVIDTQANQVTMQIDHFTDFAITGVSGNLLFLPLTWR